jgi:hypothetical protein
VTKDQQRHCNLNCRVWRVGAGCWRSPGKAWRDRILAELLVAHPDLPPKTSRIDITRYGHAMAIPVPRNHGQIGIQPIYKNTFKLSTMGSIRAPSRLHFAHSDWAGYSVFEEAFTLGHLAGLQARASL